MPTPFSRLCKRPFDTSRPVDGATLAEFRPAIAGSTVRLRITNDPALVARIRDLAAHAFATKRRTPRINSETVAITRIGHDETEASPNGIALTGPEVEDKLAKGELTRALLADPDSPAGAAAIAHYRATSATSAAYAWLSIDGEGRGHELDVGRDWLRFHLKATELGVSLEPQSESLNQYPEMEDTSQAMR